MFVGYTAPRVLFRSSLRIFSLHLFFFKRILKICIYLWLHRVSVAACGLSLVGVSGAALHGGAWLHSAVASRCKAQALGHRFQQLQHMGFSSGDAQV